MSHSEELRKAENALKQAELDREIARTAFLPKLDASAVGAYMMPDMDMMGMELRMRGTYMAGINLSQPLYAGGKIATGRRLARIGEQVATEQYRMTRMDVLVEADLEEIRKAGKDTAVMVIFTSGEKTGEIRTGQTGACRGTVCTAM